VASLNHDIKTPVASIKAATELMLVSAKDEKEKTQLRRIEDKAEQINALVTDMFHATLEDLQALSVTPAEISSIAIADLIQSADYKGLVKPFNIPDCLVIADLVRLQQVFDNIIGNSYKYAGTDIEVRAVFDRAFLLIDIADYGDGAPEADLPLLLNKFYRGKNATEKSGYGLGLYIAKYLIEHMSGELSCENRPRGFIVRLALRLAG
jgi:signal transduction histidine kinase